MDVARTERRRLSSSLFVIAATCAIAALVLGWLTLVGLSSARGSIDWTVVLVLVLYGVPAGLAAVGAIGVVAGRRWGLVTARVFAAIAVAGSSLAFLMMATAGLAGLFVSGGDAAPPGWYILVLAVIPGLIAGLAFALLRSSSAELDRWDTAEAS